MKLLTLTVLFFSLSLPSYSMNEDPEVAPDSGPLEIFSPRKVRPGGISSAKERYPYKFTGGKKVTDDNYVVFSQQKMAVGCALFVMPGQSIFSFQFSRSSSLLDPDKGGVINTLKTEFIADIKKYLRSTDEDYSSLIPDQTKFLKDLPEAEVSIDRIA